MPPLRYERRAPAEARLPGARRSCSTAASRATRRSRRSSQRVDGVMLGRDAYHDPWAHGRLGRALLRRRRPRALDRDAVEAAMVDYMERLRARRRALVARSPATCWACATAQPGARRWRQVWSDPRLKSEPPAAVSRLARRRSARRRDGTPRRRRRQYHACQRQRERGCLGSRELFAVEERAHRRRAHRQEHREDAGRRRRHVLQAGHPEPDGDDARGDRVGEQQPPRRLRDERRREAAQLPECERRTSTRPQRLMSALIRFGPIEAESFLPMTT